MANASVYLLMLSNPSDTFCRLIDWLAPAVLPLLLELAAMVGLYVVLT
jgi:hypothetical protein